jgi:hypothetical protein
MKIKGLKMRKFGASAANRNSRQHAFSDVGPEQCRNRGFDVQISERERIGLSGFLFLEPSKLSIGSRQVYTKV